MSSGLKGFSSARQEARRRLDDGLKSMASENDENPPVTCTLVCLGETSDMSLVPSNLLDQLIVWQVLTRVSFLIKTF